MSRDTGRPLPISPMSSLPKLSYVLLSHNREKYIRKALESAFAQDYEGELEYIISDDCSTDSTLDIIRECVAAYKGKRRIVVTQPPRNMNLAGNTNHAVSFVESDWIIRADDDDLSTIDRCTLIGRAIAEHPDCTYVVTGVDKFTDAEEQTALHRSQTPCGANVSTTRVDIREGFEAFRGHQPKIYSYKAWNMAVFRTFGPLDLDAYYIDDLTCYYRANMLGSGLFLDNAIAVLARDGSGNMSRGGDDSTRHYKAILKREEFNDRYHNLSLRPLQETYQAMLDYVKAHLSDEEQKLIQPFLTDFQQELQTRARICTYWRGSTLNRIRIARELGYHGLFAWLRCLPLPLFARLLALYRTLTR